MRCLRALSAQCIDRSLYEVIVVSDGKDPKTEQVLKPWLRNAKIRLSYLHTSERKGPAAARNLGWLTAKSALVAFTDDDCIPEKNWLKSILSAGEGLGMAAFSGYTKVPLPERPTDFAMNTAGLETAEFITANCACTKEALLRTGGFDERFKLAWREDSDLHFKLLEQHIPIIKLSSAVVVHPVREAPWGISIREQRKAAYEALLFSKYPDLYRRKIGIRIWNYYLINMLWLILAMSLVAGLPTAAGIASGVLGTLLLLIVIKRLRRTSKSVMHILEMVSTSLVIPTLSVYWRLYGAFKYRVVFI